MKTSPPTLSGRLRPPAVRSPTSFASSYDSIFRPSRPLIEIPCSNLRARGPSYRRPSMTSSTASASASADARLHGPDHDLCRLLVLDRDLQPPGRSALPRRLARDQARGRSVRSDQPCAGRDLDLSRPPDVAS